MNTIILEEKYYTITELGQILNIHPVTIRNWERNKELKDMPIPVHRTNGNQRRYLGKDIKKYLGFDCEKEKNKEKVGLPRKTIIYARVSSQDQKEDLETQKKLLSIYASAKGFEYEIFAEIFSGLNFKRPKFQKIIELIEQNQVERIIINHKDRLMRFGYEMFEKICQQHNVEIIILDKTEKDHEQELLDDFISLITSFSGKIYGKRSHKNKKLIHILKEKEE